jgi:hypothetical protein
MITGIRQWGNRNGLPRPVEKNKLVDMAEKLSKPQGAIGKSKNFQVIRSADLRTNDLCEKCLLTRSEASIGKRVPIGKHPNFGEVLVLALVAVVRRKHFPELLGQFLCLLRGGYVVLALLMVPNPKSGAAAIAQLKGFDRIRGILRQFLVEYRHRTVYVACHVILRWGEDLLASMVVTRRSTSWGKAGTKYRQGNQS